MKNKIGARPAVILLSLFVYNTQAIVLSVIEATKDNKKVVILADCHVPLINKQGVTDEKAEFEIICSALDTLEKCYFGIEEAEWHVKETKSDAVANTITQLARLTLQNKGKVANTKIELIDLRTSELNALERCYKVLELPDDKISKKTLALIPQITVQEFLEHMLELINKLKVELTALKINSFDQDIKDAIEAHSLITTALEKHEHISVSLLKNLKILFQYERQLIFPLMDAYRKEICNRIADLGYIIALNKALSSYNNIILYMGVGHALKIKEYLSSLGYQVKLTGVKSLEQAIPYTFMYRGPLFAPQQLKAMLANIFTDKPADQEEKEAINHKKCANPACDKDGDKQCGRCKKVKYCSQECQKADWSKHKSNCEPAKKK